MGWRCCRRDCFSLWRRRRIPDCARPPPTQKLPAQHNHVRPKAPTCNHSSTRCAPTHPQPPASIHVDSRVGFARPPGRRGLNPTIRTSLFSASLSRQLWLPHQGHLATDTRIVQVVTRRVKNAARTLNFRHRIPASVAESVAEAPRLPQSTRTIRRIQPSKIAAAADVPGDTQSVKFRPGMDAGTIAIVRVPPDRADTELCDVLDHRSASCQRPAQACPRPVHGIWRTAKTHAAFRTKIGSEQCPQNCFQAPLRPVVRRFRQALMQCCVIHARGGQPYRLAHPPACLTGCELCVVGAQRVVT